MVDGVRRGGKIRPDDALSATARNAGRTTGELDDLLEITRLARRARRTREAAREATRAKPPAR